MWFVYGMCFETGSEGVSCMKGSPSLLAVFQRPHLKHSLMGSCVGHGFDGGTHHVVDGVTGMVVWCVRCLRVECPKSIAAVARGRLSYLCFACAQSGPGHMRQLHGVAAIA